MTLFWMIIDISSWEKNLHKWASEWACINNMRYECHSMVRCCMHPSLYRNSKLVVDVSKMLVNTHKWSSHRLSLPSTTKELAVLIRVGNKINDQKVRRCSMWHAGRLSYFNWRSTYLQAYRCGHSIEIVRSWSFTDFILMCSVKPLLIKTVDPGMIHEAQHFFRNPDVEASL